MIFQNRIKKEKNKQFKKKIKKSQNFLEGQVWQQLLEMASDGDPFAQLLHGSLKVISPDKSLESVVILYHFL